MTWRIVSQPAGPGYVCVGDAAAVLDPASSHGVLKGLMSGMMAVHVIAQAESGTASMTAATEAYSAWLREWFQADARALRRMYQDLPHPPVLGSRALRLRSASRSSTINRCRPIEPDSWSVQVVSALQIPRCPCCPAVFPVCPKYGRV